VGATPSPRDPLTAQTRVGDLMRTTVVTVSPTASIPELVRLLKEHGISGAPVVSDDGTVVGTVSVSDLVWLCDEYAGATPERRSGTGTPGLRTVRDVMTPDVFGVTSGGSLAELARFFSRTGLRRAMVLDGARLAGLVSATDLLDRIVGDEV
jgi:CBS domain-containing protein